MNYELIEYDHEQCILTGIADINELKKMEDELNKHASTDMLSGIMNRRRGFERLQSEIDQTLQKEGEFIVCFVDVNGLKEVNDRYGHSEGDYLIRYVAKVIESELGTDDIFFRYGGDEFVIVFIQKQMPEVQVIWTRLRQTLVQHNSARTKPFAVSVSYGLFPYHSSLNLTIEQIIERADQEMHKNKESYNQK